MEGVFSSSGDRTRAVGAEVLASRELASPSWAQSALGSLFFTLFPSHCRLCDAPLFQLSRLPVCASCLAALHPATQTLCSICGGSVSSPLAALESAPVCGLCGRAHPPFQRAVAYGSYEGVLRDLIHLLKYRQVHPAAKVLGCRLAEVIAKLQPEFGEAPVLVLAVPLHSSKSRERGFNQAELIAADALKRLHLGAALQLDSRSLVRRRETRSQIGLSRHQRRENMRGAFAVPHPPSVEGREILLVDDVLTTGATAAECARVLLRAGVRRVWVATVARALKTSAVVLFTDYHSGTGTGEETKDDQVAAGVHS